MAQHVDLLQTLLMQMSKPELQVVAHNVLPVIDIPRGTAQKLASTLSKWVADDINTRLPPLFAQVLKYLGKAEFAWFLCTHCHVKIPCGSRKDDVVSMLFDELRKVRHVAADIGNADARAAAAAEKVIGSVAAAVAGGGAEVAAVAGAAAAAVAES